MSSFNYLTLLVKGWSSEAVQLDLNEESLHSCINQPLQEESFTTKEIREVLEIILREWLSLWFFAWINLRQNKTKKERNRKSHQRRSVRKRILRNFTKFTGKHLSCRPPFFTEHLWVTASKKKKRKEKVSG